MPISAEQKQLQARTAARIGAEKRRGDSSWGKAMAAARWATRRAVRANRIRKIA